jgi:hypothetical protein
MRNCGELLYEASVVAFGAIHFFPHVADIHRVLELQSVRTDGFRLVSISLRDDDMAGIAIMRDGFS